ncbi:MAG: hypothetical protein ACUZ8E_13235 [Candidatus Anammoxibacter sp.]
MTGGEKWEGVKLFELNREGCLICFAGNTMRAYPLILNLISSVSLNSYLQSNESSTIEVIEYISDLFTSFTKTIVDEIKSPDYDIHQMRAEAKFLFGGWDWQQGTFKIWKLYYSKDAEGFLFDELTNDDTKTRFYTFLGDASTDIEKEAQDRFKKLLLDEDKMDSKLDMEPLTILRDIALDKSIREVGGSLQIAKIYKSSKTEFFGILWPSSEGKPHFQGREYHNITKPLVRYYNPDTFEILDLELPQTLQFVTEEIYGNNTDFINECYPNGALKERMSGKEKQFLKSIFKDVAYFQFIENEQKEAES